MSKNNICGSVDYNSKYPTLILFSPRALFRKKEADK